MQDLVTMFKARMNILMNGRPPESADIDHAVQSVALTFLTGAHAMAMITKNPRYIGDVTLLIDEIARHENIQRWYWWNEGNRSRLPPEPSRN